MEEAIQNLPPTKRFKFLRQQLQEPSIPHVTTIACLPAKKRVWAPPPVSPLKPHQLPQSPSKPKAQQDSGPNPISDDEDGVICAVCGSTDGDPSDPIVFCDGPDCSLTVHASCYGNPLIHSIPDDDWFCSKCCFKKRNNDEEEEVKCCLCPRKGGAVKPTTDGKWAHVVCALFVPEVFFRDPQGREGIDCSEVPEWRKGMKCYLCGCRIGCGIGCSEPKCQLGFHASCGVDDGLSVEFKEGKTGGGIVAGFCGTHTQLWKKQQLTGKFKIVAREKECKRKSRG